MPTYQPRPRFLRDFKNLTAAQVAAWEKALDTFIECLRSGRFEPGLRVKRVQGYQAVADQLGRTIAHGDPDQAKALLRILIAELRVNSRSEILPTYRLSAPTVCAQTSSVGDTGLEPVTSALSRRRSPS